MKPKPPTSPISLKLTCGVLLALILVGMIIAAGVPVLMPVYQQIQAQRRAQFEKPFVDQMEAYTGRFSPASGSGSRQKLQGKILVMNPVTKMVDDSFYLLPDDRQAQTPAEVSVLAWLDCHTLETYYYPGGILIVEQEYCKLTMIDWTTRSIVGTREFVGKTPPAQVEVDKYGRPVNSEDIDSTVNRQEVLDWLLPQVE
jgi:type II secretory pathway pseudopilin PulG